MTDTRFRLVMIGLALLLVAVIAFAVGIAPSGSELEIPDEIESLLPGPNQAFAPQVGLAIDMQTGYDIQLFVDGQPVFAGEIDRIEPTGQFFWKPQPGQAIEEWTPGLHTVRIEWDRVVGLPDPGSFEWSFRIQ